MQSEILVISRVFFPDPGGIQEYVYNRCCQDPDRVIVLTSSCPGDRAFDQSQPFPVYRWYLPPLGWLGKLGGLVKQMLNLIGSVIWGIWLFWRYRYRSIEWCHGYDFPSLLILSYLLPVQCFIYLHGDDVLCPLKNPILRWLFEWTLNRTQTIVCNSRFTQDYLQKHFCIDRPIVVLHPTIRPAKFGNLTSDYLDKLRFHLRQEYGIPQDAIVVLSVGRLVRRKGFDQVIRFLPTLLAEGVNLYYLVCGKGAMEAELRSLATELGVESRVMFAGYVPDTALAGYYAACDLFSMITTYDQNARSIEGFGIVYLEAGYFGKPVLAAKSGGVEDAVQPGETGLLVNPDDATESCNALRQLCLDPDLRDRLGQRGKALAIRHTPHRTLYDQD